MMQHFTFVVYYIDSVIFQKDPDGLRFHRAQTHQALLRQVWTVNQQENK
ncbi:unnamed protein product [Cylicostephanus goldi]|uniref:Uncharacterized protein n=1 Tax=Cylicostephanus goldi TaxID=71465 RepID=A0A3P6RXQ1_CYLGO|nr:unnamed protein product [Cylicostephanus goldi]